MEKETDMERLKKIDVLRERTGKGYGEARKLLEAHNYDLVETLVALEEEGDDRDWSRERMYVKGSELVEQVKEILRKGNATRLRVRHRGETILIIPVTFGAVGAIMAPTLAVLASVATLFSGATLEIEREGEGTDGEEDGSDTATEQAQGPEDARNRGTSPEIDIF